MSTILENLMAMEHEKKWNKEEKKWTNNLKIAESFNDFADVITSNSYVVHFCQEKLLQSSLKNKLQLPFNFELGWIFLVTVYNFNYKLMTIW